MTVSTASTISPVHGGLSKPVNRIEPRDRVNYPAWRKLPAIEVNDNDRTSLYRTYCQAGLLTGYLMGAFINLMCPFSGLRKVKPSSEKQTSVEPSSGSG